MIPADIQSRLAALGVPVLLPEEMETVLSGRRPGEAGGISGYLAANPDGYVQIEEPFAVSTDDYVARYWIPVAAIALTAERAGELSRFVHLALCGHPWEPGPYTRAIADQPRREAGFFLCRPSYEIPEINGVLAV